MPKDTYRLRPDALHELNKYVDLIVNPTLDDLQGNLKSPRLAFIACLVTAHCLDRLTDQQAHARQIWRNRCNEFGFVEYVCNTTKHVSADSPLAPKKANAIPMHFLLPAFNTMPFNTAPLGASGTHPHNVLLACREVVRFAQEEIVRLSGLDENEFD
jgi:hypothetical protein